MELTFGHWFGSLVVLAFFIFLAVPVTISLISHLILVTSISLLFAWTVFHIIGKITFFISLGCLFPTRIYCDWTWGWSWGWAWSQGLGFHNWFFKLDFFWFLLMVFLGFLGLAETLFTTSSVFGVLLCLEGSRASLKVNPWRCRLLTLLLTVVSLVKAAIVGATFVAVLTLEITVTVAASLPLIWTTLMAVVAVLALVAVIALAVLVALAARLGTAFCFCLGPGLPFCLKVSTLWTDGHGWSGWRCWFIPSLSLWL